MGYIQVRYDSRVINYNRRGFIRLATSKSTLELIHTHLKLKTFFLPLCVYVSHTFPVLHRQGKLYCRGHLGLQNCCSITEFFLKPHSHPNCFYWGHQCSWILTPANSMQVSIMQFDNCNRK